MKKKAPLFRAVFHSIWPLLINLVEDVVEEWLDKKEEKENEDRATQSQVSINEQMNRYYADKIREQVNKGTEHGFGEGLVKLDDKEPKFTWP